MNNRLKIYVCLLVIGILTLRARPAAAQSEAVIEHKQADTAVDFGSQIRPLLSENCFACHGFDEQARQADLRLDTLEGATADLGGRAAVVPGAPERSELLRRIRTQDRDEVMPPLDSHRRPLSPEQVELVERWILQGARWEHHWSLLQPQPSEVPEGVHPVDYFVSRRLDESYPDLKPNPPAEPSTLLRRLSFDLTGMPPLPSTTAARMSDRFLAAPTDANWTELIDACLASEHFGERMAMWWLDSARYSDTDGFQQDALRENWPWRDWVIDAFNTNMPFDQFTIEQTAGDLLPGATDRQRLATCFHRNHMHNGEGGRDPEESRVDYVLDRVNTLGTVWLGLTLGCTQCHDHKFDPISQEDYYSLTAYFNSIDESGQAGAKAEPFLEWKSHVAEREIHRNERLLAEVQDDIAQQRAAARAPFQQWLNAQMQDMRQHGFEAWQPAPVVAWHTSEGYRLDRADENTFTAEPCDLPQDDYVLSCTQPAKLQRITAVRLDVLPHASHTDGKLSHSPSGEFILTNFKLRLRRRGSSQYREIELASAIADVDGKGKDAKYAGVSGTLDDDPRTGWTTRNYPADQPHWAVYELSEPLSMQADEELDIMLMQRSLENRELIGRFRLSFTDQRGAGLRSREPLPLERLFLAMSDRSLGALSAAEVQRDESLGEALFDQFLRDDKALNVLERRQKNIKQQLLDAKQAAGALQVTVLREREQPRPTHVLERGVWDVPGKRVFPGVLPAVLPTEPAQVPSRLELGKWLVSRKNPLTARVIANQIWQLMFGAGLVRTPGDFGFQGEPPTHPELLDWLAVEFMDSGWDIKHLVKTIVSSQTYRQSSRTTPQLLERDPENRSLARGARFRLPAWMIRDGRLAVSGLLNHEVGGPPVFPFQPEGVWKDQFMGRLTYQPTLGPGQYRRTIYAFWRRSSPPAFLFDAASRRTCEVQQRTTNTPLHALTLLNDLTGQEAARSLADQALSQSPEAAAQCRWLWQRILGRDASVAEFELLETQYAHHLEHYRRNPSQARELLHAGQLETPPKQQLPQRAAAMILASLILNLDECLTHE